MAEGQYTGEREVYVYTDDNDVDYQVQIDKTLGEIAGTGLVEATSADAQNFLPRRFKMRGVYWEGTLNGSKKRKFIVCQSDGDLYKRNSSQTVTIDGVSGQTTGRKGEAMSFLKVNTVVAIN